MMNDPMKTIDKNNILGIFNGYPNIKEFVDCYCPKEHNYLYAFVTFGHLYAHDLLQYGYYDHYTQFINLFNEVVIKNFYLETKGLGQYFTNHVDIHGHMLLEKQVHLKNKRDIFTYHKIRNYKEFKYESKLKETIIQTPELWDRDLTIQTEQNIGYGICDICILDENKKHKYAIELKKSSAKRKDIYQTFEYTLKNSGYIGVLIASRFKQDVLDVANKLGVMCYSYHICNLIDDFKGFKRYKDYIKLIAENNEKNDILYYIIDDLNKNSSFEIDYGQWDDPNQLLNVVLENNNLLINHIVKVTK